MLTGLFGALRPSITLKRHFSCAAFSAAIFSSSFLFSSMAMGAVGRAAMSMIEEVRRQFRDIPELKAALEVMRKYDSDMSKATPEDRAIFDAADGVAEYDKCVDISTKASIKEMVLPGLLALAVPVAIGFVGGAEMLGGLLAGVTTCGVLMAIFQSNAGGAWDNAKKMIEEQGKKGTEAHKAAVVGDTVGDPFKDTSGPSLNILLKLMSVVALVIAPSISNVGATDNYDYEMTDIDRMEESMMALQENFDGTKLQFECHNYQVEFNGSRLTLVINTAAIKSKELGGILTTENYLNSKENPILEFFGEEVQKTNGGDFQYVVNGKMKTKSLMFEQGSTQLAFNYDQKTQKLVGELRFAKPEHFEGIKGVAIGILLD